MNENVVELTDVTKKYGPVVAMESISLRIIRGEVLGVLGPNGAGKTTTVECAIGLRTPDAGTVRVLGLDPARIPTPSGSGSGCSCSRPCCRTG